MSANVERSLKSGADRVTVVMRAGMRLWHGTTASVDSRLLAPCDEGVTWARGWVDEDSDEGKALIAAYDLVHG